MLTFGSLHKNCFHLASLSIVAGCFARMLSRVQLSVSSSLAGVRPRMIGVLAAAPSERGGEDSTLCCCYLSERLSGFNWIGEESSYELCRAAVLMLKTD